MATGARASDHSRRTVHAEGREENVERPPPGGWRRPFWGLGPRETLRLVPSSRLARLNLLVSSRSRWMTKSLTGVMYVKCTMKQTRCGQDQRALPEEFLTAGKNPSPLMPLQAPQQAGGEQINEKGRSWIGAALQICLSKELDFEVGAPRRLNAPQGLRAAEFLALLQCFLRHFQNLP